MLSMAVAVPVDTLIDTLAVLYTHPHAQYTFLTTQFAVLCESPLSA